MKMTRRQTTRLVILGLILGVVLLSLVAVGLRAVPRRQALEKYSGSTELAALVALTPDAAIEIPSPYTNASRVVDVGYARFSFLRTSTCM